MSALYASVNKAWVDHQKASLLVSDLSIQRGYGIFDYFRTIRSEAIFLEDHLDRFYHSAAMMHLEVPLSREALKERIGMLIQMNQIPDSGIKITLTGGYSQDGFTPATPNLVITQVPFIFQKASFVKGIRLITYEYQRQLPEVKTIDYLQAIWLQPLIKEKHAEDVLYHQGGEIRECPRSNIFVVNQEGELLTPAHRVLKGITRKKILLFPEFQSRETVITLEDLLKAKEAFLTSSTKNVLPVLEIDGKAIGEGKPGKLTTQVFERVCRLKDAEVIC